MSLIRKTVDLFRLNPDYENRVFGLDLMRALAIIFVMVGHSIILDKANTNFPFIPMINGVELFFVLSGFLIGGILLKMFQKSESFGLRTISTFWVRRWFRTLPNYYLVLLLNIAAVYFGIINGDFSQFSWKFFLFLQNFSGPFTGFFLESWSLTIEEWFYLLFPIILGVISFLLILMKRGKKTIFLSAICVFLLIPFLIRLFKASQMNVDSYWLAVGIFKVVIFRIDSIALGLFGAFIKYWYPEFWYKNRNRSFALGVVLSYVILYTVWEPNAFITKVFYIFFQSIGCFLMLPKFDSMTKAPKIIVKVITRISLISYSIYLINLALVAEVITTNIPPSGPLSAWALYGLYWIAVLSFATLLYKYYEKPMMDLRDRIKK
jgi:peptidoglycan/LPS O-acetylase OafA/YrhL